MADTENYIREELTVDEIKAQVNSIVYFIPFLVILGIPYVVIWKETFTKETFNSLFGPWGIYALLALVLGIVFHELIHGLTWSLFAKKGLQSIRYGILKKTMTPYCHCSEPLSVKHYIIGAAMPGIVLGILPAVIALFTGSLSLFALGMFFTMAAGGDMMIIYMLRKQPMHYLVQDHPSKIGCYLFKPIDSGI